MQPCHISHATPERLAVLSQLSPHSYILLYIHLLHVVMDCQKDERVSCNIYCITYG